MTIREFAGRIGLKVRTVRGLVVSGKIKAQKSENGYEWIIEESEFDRVMEARSKHADKNRKYTD